MKISFLIYTDLGSPIGTKLHNCIFCSYVMQVCSFVPIGLPRSVYFGSVVISAKFIEKGSFDVHVWQKTSILIFLIKGNPFSNFAVVIIYIIRSKQAIGGAKDNL